MPARNRVGLSENTRKRIQTTMIVKRLSEHLFGDVELTQTQIRAAEILLRKTLPDLSAIEHSGEVNLAETMTEVVSRLNARRRAGDESRAGAGNPDPGVDGDSGQVRH